MEEEAFTVVPNWPSQPKLFDQVVYYNSAHTADHDLPYLRYLRQEFPEMIVTTCPEMNAPLRAFAAAGYAQIAVDKTSDSYASWRGYVPPARRSDKGLIGEELHFAKYNYTWGDANFIFYLIGQVQYILTEPRSGEQVLGPSKVTDQLISTIGELFYNLSDVIWVYDGYWRQDADLFKQVQKASWDNVILDEDMKADLTSVAHKFFDSEAVYKDLGVPWKRGLLFHGPPGNGKTVSIKALMHSLYQREKPIPTLYVKNAPYTWNIGDVFAQARRQAPCMLVLEDVETIVTNETRSYFFNEMDGLASNDGLFIVGSTNFLDRLDPGLTKRPSRFDRKYLFPLPNQHERELYCEFWRRKLKPKKTIDFPKFLCPAMAMITPEFTFAYLQECFTATLLIIAGRRTDSVDAASNATSPLKDDKDDDFEKYELWRVFDEQADIIRRQIGSEDPEDANVTAQAQTNLPMRSRGFGRPSPEHVSGPRGSGGRFDSRAPPARSSTFQLPYLVGQPDVLLPSIRGKDTRFTATAFETV